MTMAGHLPQLDRVALMQLRAAVRQLQDPHRRSLPIRTLVELATSAPTGPGFTIDFDASRELGDALIVIRVPASEPTAIADSRLERLSRREREVAELVATGLSNKAIADRLCIATSTVKDHIHNIFEKTALSNRAAIAAACRAPLRDV